MLSVADDRQSGLSMTAALPSPLAVAHEDGPAPTPTTRTEAGGEPASVRALSHRRKGRGRSQGHSFRALAVHFIAATCLGWAAVATMIAGPAEPHEPLILPQRPATEQERQQHDRDLLLEEMRRLHDQASQAPRAVSVLMPADD